MSVCHKCDTPPCVNDDHLFLGTVKDNTEDMCAKGRQAAGESHPSCRLTQDQIRDIRRLVSDGQRQRHVAALFGVGYKAISKIVRRQRWKHIV